MTMPAPLVAFDELITFLAASPSAEAIMAYRPSQDLQDRLSELLEKNRQGQLSTEENAELDMCGKPLKSMYVTRGAASNVTWTGEQLRALVTSDIIVG